MDKVDVTFATIAEAIEAIELPECDYVVGIARGGVVPASLIAFMSGCELGILTISYRDDQNHPNPDGPVIGPLPRIPSFKKG